MVPTSLSLLERLKQQPDPASWQRLEELYRPLIRHWVSQMPGFSNEADDVTQDVLLVLVRELPNFERRRAGSFRTWLRTVTVNRVRTYGRERGRRPAAGLGDAFQDLLANLEDPQSALSGEWDREHDRHVLQRLLALVRADFEATTWTAFERFALSGSPAAQVAREVGLSENAVILAKARVLRRLREEAAGLVDD